MAKAPVGLTFSIDMVVRREVINIVEVGNGVRITQLSSFGFPWTVLIPSEKLGEVIGALQQIQGKLA